MLIEPPENSGYMIAAYLIAAVVLLGYWVRLWRKGRKVSKSVSWEEKA